MCGPHCLQLRPCNGRSCLTRPALRACWRFSQQTFQQWYVRNLYPPGRLEIQQVQLSSQFRCRSHQPWSQLFHFNTIAIAAEHTCDDMFGYVLWRQRRLWPSFLSKSLPSDAETNFPRRELIESLTRVLRFTEFGPSSWPRNSCAKHLHHCSLSRYSFRR